MDAGDVAAVAVDVARVTPAADPVRVRVAGGGVGTVEELARQGMLTLGSWP